MHKVIDIVRVGDQAVNDDAGDVVLHEVAPTLLTNPGLVALQVNVARVGTRARFSRVVWPHLVAVHAIVSRVYAEPVDDQTSAYDQSIAARVGMHVPWSFSVTEHSGIARVRDWPAGVPTPGLKHVSLLGSTVTTPAFRAAYRHHVELVVEHLPLMWQYVQNDIDRAEGDRAHEFAAISELSYRSEADYERRWKNGPDSETEFRSHEGFLDLPKTVTLLCTEHVLRSP